MIKKNHHRTERKKKERIQRAQLRTAQETGRFIELNRPTAQVSPQRRELPELKISIPRFL